MALEDVWRGAVNVTNTEAVEGRTFLDRVTPVLKEKKKLAKD